MVVAGRDRGRVACRWRRADKLYPLDLDRAFKKLDTIKSEIIWWTGGAQSQQLLASAEAPFGSFWNGRLTALEQTGVKVGVSWEQNITAADFAGRAEGRQEQGRGDEIHRIGDQRRRARRISQPRPATHRPISTRQR